MKLFPESADTQLEFNKIKNLLAEHCKTEYAKNLANNLFTDTKIDVIRQQLLQAHEYKLILQNLLIFPADNIYNLSNQIRLLGIEGAVLDSAQFIEIKKLTENIRQVFKWFDNERKLLYPALSMVITGTYYEKIIIELINEILDENGIVKDNASDNLLIIRRNLYSKRNEQRRVFNRFVDRYNKQGYLSDIEESFINGRRVLAVFAEQKKMIKGILHGESDSRRTSFIEPEEMIELNNAIFSLEIEERREIYKLLMTLTSKLSVYATLLKNYHDILGQFDFIKAKALFALNINGNLPSLIDNACLKLENACHPLLYLFNKKSGKETIHLNITLDNKNRILVISGPNAGGKTVTLKTIGLLQMMVQSGLLVSCSPDSEFGIFKQLMIHIGDTQSLEFELSTYSSHLRNMKYFMENANGKTLFFIDELGSGSDPNLGGAFAEVIMEELAKKHSLGIVTTHYLNLKVMANKVPGIINGAMAFDEQNLKPLYRLITGKPGSSYTFSIAKRIGLDHVLINKARQLVDENHFSLDKLLNRTEQDLQKIDEDKKRLSQLLKENERLKKEMENFINQERHQQQIEKMKHENKISIEKMNELKDLERKIKSLVIEWRRSENKDEIIKMINALFFKQKEKFTVLKQQKKIDEKFEETGKDISKGDKVKMKKSRQVGIVNEIRGKKAIVQIGLMPISVDISELIGVKERVQ